METANKEVSKYQEALKVEDSLNAASTKSQSLPDDLWKEIQEIQSNNLIANADQRYAAFMQLVQNCDALLHSLSQDVNQYTYQNPYGPRPIDPNQLIANVNKVADDISRGKPGKDAIDKTMQSIHKFSALLSSPREVIATHIPAVQMSSLCVNALEEVRTINDDLKAMMEKRASDVDDILTMARNDVVVQDKLIGNPNIDEKGIFSQCFVPIQSRMREFLLSLNNQESLLRNLQAKCATYTQYCAADSSAKILEEFYHNLNLAIKDVKTAEEKILQGITYFSAVEGIMKSVQAQLDQCKNGQPQGYPGPQYGGSKVCSRCNVLNNPQSTKCCNCYSPL